LIKITIAFLLVASLAYGAQPGITIPVGTSEYGPVAVQTLHRYAGLSIEPTSSAFTRATINLFHSTDKAQTFAAIPFCRLVYSSSVALKPFAGDCSKPAGTTHIKAVAILEGGSLTIAKTPNLRSR
jgi:hypothetical protein